MALVHLIYVSHTPTELGSVELGRLLESSVRHNLAQHITGMLLYLNCSFMQVIEGEEAAVDETYSRILQDPRHTGIMLIERATIKTQSFGHWSMGFKRLQSKAVADHPAYSPLLRVGLDAAAIGARKGLAMELLNEFARNQRI
jgi:hypothetical protein